MPRAKEFDETAVLDKALELFQSKGYYATSAQDLVEQLCISRSSLYDTYGDKHSLFIQALKRYRLTASQGMIDAINTSTDIRQTIRQIFEAAVTASLEDQLSKGCFMVNATIELAPHDAEVAEIIRQNMADVENALKIAIEKGQAMGVFSTHQSATALARFLFNTISGLRVSAKLQKDATHYNDVVAVTLSILEK